MGVAAYAVRQALPKKAALGTCRQVETIYFRTYVRVPLHSVGSRRGPCSRRGARTSPRIGQERSPGPPFRRRRPRISPKGPAFQASCRSHRHETSATTVTYRTSRRMPLQTSLKRGSRRALSVVREGVPIRTVGTPPLATDRRQVFFLEGRSAAAGAVEPVGLQACGGRWRSKPDAEVAPLALLWPDIAIWIGGALSLRTSRRDSARTLRSCSCSRRGGVFEPLERT